MSKILENTGKWLIYFILLCIFVILICVYIQNILLKQILTNMYNTIGNHKPKLEELIEYCNNNIPYYMNNKINTVNKFNIRNNYQSFFNKGKYDKRMEWTINSANNSWTELKDVKKKNMTIFGFFWTLIGLLSGKSVAQVTGGTSGEYYYQWYDLNDLWWGGYSFVKGWHKMGWNPSEKILIYYFHGANSIKLLEYTNLLSFLPQYINVQVPTFTHKNDINDDSVIEFINKINKDKPELIISFPSVIFRVCQKIHEKNIKLLHIPKYMDLSADFLFTCQYRFIKSIFTYTDIRLSYGTIEFGQIAQQVPGEMYTYEVYEDVAYVENDENNNLIVSAFNYKTLPLLKYKTDDKGIVSNLNDKQYIHNLVGKQNGSVDYLELDNIVNKLQEPNIINIRINNNNLILTILDNVEEIEKHFPTWNVIFDICNKNKCITQDTYNRKVTPVLKEYDYN